MQILSKRTIACCVAAVAVAAAWSSHSQPQKASVYTSTNPTNYDPAAATLVLETVRHEIPIPAPLHAPPKYVYLPECVSGAPQADCTAAIDIYKEIQSVTETLGDRQLGRGSTLSVIIMDRHHPNYIAAGLYSARHNAIVLYPSAAITPSVLPHETGHVYFEKHIGKGSCSLPCDAAGIKRWGVNEGFAKIVAHRHGGPAPRAPSAGNAADIVAGCSLGTANGAAACAHDLGNLVFDAYEEVVDQEGKSIAFNFYRQALLNLASKTVTPATLHEEVRDLLVAKARREGMVIEEGVLPDVPDPFVLSIWQALLWVYSIQC